MSLAEIIVLKQMNPRSKNRQQIAKAGLRRILHNRAKSLWFVLRFSLVRLVIGSAGELIPDKTRDSVNGLTASSVAYKRLRVGGLVERSA